VDYSWDNIYAAHQLILQVYENKSNVYDPRRVGAAQPLHYENHVYIRLESSFDPAVEKPAGESDLVMVAKKEGKVMLARWNVTDSTRSQMWRMASDGCLENIGMNLRVDASQEERYVLDVLEG